MTRSIVARAQYPAMARIAAAKSGQAQIRFPSDRPVAAIERDPVRNIEPSHAAAAGTRSGQG